MTDWLEQLVCFGQRSPDMDEWVNVLFIAVMAALWIVGGLIRNAARNRAKGEGAAKEQGRQRQESWQQRLMRKAEEMQRLAEARQKELAERASRGGQGGAASPSLAARAGEQPGLDGLSLQKGRRGQAVMVYDAGEARRDLRRPQQPTPAPPPSGRRVIRPRPVVSPRARPAPTPPQKRPRGPLRAAREAIRVARTAQAAARPPVETPPALGASQETPIVSGLPETTLGPALGPQKPGRRAPTASAVRSDLLIDYSDPDALRRAIVQYEILGKPLALRNPLERTAGF